MKSNALKQITKQIKRLADLQTIELSVVFCVRDNVQERQLIKFCGSGEFLQNLKEGKPILGVEEIKRLSKTQEGYLPRIEHTVPLQMLTPSKLSCGPGVSKQIASRQKEMLEATSIITEDQDNSFSIGLCLNLTQVFFSLFFHCKKRKENLSFSIIKISSFHTAKYPIKNSPKLYGS